MWSWLVMIEATSWQSCQNYLFHNTIRVYTSLIHKPLLYLTQAVQALRCGLWISMHSLYIGVRCIHVWIVYVFWAWSYTVTFYTHIMQLIMWILMSSIWRTPHGHVSPLFFNSILCPSSYNPIEISVLRYYIIDLQESPKINFLSMNHCSHDLNELILIDQP